MQQLRNTFKLAFLMGAVTTGCIALGLRSYELTEINNKMAEKYTGPNPKELVKQHNPKKYMEIYEAGKNDMKSAWYEAARQVQDSLRMDSVARTNYAKGQQMVRDSIKRASLADTAKVISKLR